MICRLYIGEFCYFTISFESKNELALNFDYDNESLISSLFDTKIELVPKSGLI